MRTPIATLLAVVVLAPLSPSLPPAAPGDGDGERIKRLLGSLTIRAVQSLPGLTAQPSGRIVARTAIPTTMLSSLRRYQVEVEGEPYPVTVAFLDLEWTGGAGRVGVGATRGGTFFGPALYDDFGKEQDALDPVLAQFKGQGGVRLTEASLEPVGEVMSKRDEVQATTKPPPNKDERRVWALFQHHRRMWEFETAHEALQRARQEGTSMREPLRRLEDQLVELKGFAANLKGVLEPKEIGQYRRFLDDMVAATEKARVLLDKENEAAASKLVKGTVKIGCGKCHGWDENHWRKPLEDVVREQREAAGWRTGSFVVGVDLRPSAFDEGDAQLVASTVKALMLLATGAS